jgi:hypothetical protein
MEIKRILTRNEYVTESLEECRTKLAKPGKAHLILSADRPGVKVLMSAIEWYWYKPFTPANDLFEIRYTPWEEMDWIVVSFPDNKLGAVKHLASLLILQVTDRIPMLATTDKNEPGVRPLGNDLYVKPFPLAFMSDNVTRNPLVWCLENDKSSLVYKNRHNDRFLEREGHIIDVLATGKHLTPRQIVDYIYHNKQID